MMGTRLLARVVMALIAWGCLAESRAGDVVFSRDVWPVMRRRCYSCHAGPAAEGGLRMETEQQLRAGGSSGPLFVPGKPDESRLVEVIVGDRPEMPPERPLAAAQVDLLRRWVAEGARIDRVPVDTTLDVVIPKDYAFPPAVAAVAFDPAGARVACGCRSELVIVPLEGDAGPLRVPTASDLVSHVEFSPDGTLLAVVGGSPGRHGEVRVVRASDGTLVSSRIIGRDTLFRGGFSPDGRHLAVGGADGAVHVVPLDEKSEVRRIELHSDWVMDVAWTPDGKRLVSGSRDKTTKVSSFESGSLLRSVDTATERINAVATDDKVAVSTGLNRAITGYVLEIALKDVEVTGAGNGAKPVSRLDQYVRRLESPPGEVLDIAMSGDRRTIAVAGRFPEVRLYTVADQRRVGQVAGVRAPVFSVALNRDATRLAVGSQDGMLEVFELPAGKRLVSLVPVPVAATTAASKAGR